MNQDLPRGPKKNVTYDPKLTLYGDPWTPGDFNTRPSLSLHVIDSAGNPKNTSKSATVGVWIQCYLNHPDEDKKSKSIDIKFDLNIAGIFLALLEKAVAAPDKFVMTGILSRGFIFPGGVKSDKPVKQGTVHIAKNGEGELCLVVKAYKRPDSVYPFRLGYWADLVYKNEEKIPPSEASVLVAAGWVKILNGLLPLVGKEVYDEKNKFLSGSSGDSDMYEDSTPPAHVTGSTKSKATDIFDELS